MVPGGLPPEQCTGLFAKTLVEGGGVGGEQHTGGGGERKCVVFCTTSLTEAPVFARLFALLLLGFGRVLTLKKNFLLKTFGSFSPAAIFVASSASGIQAVISGIS